MLIAVNVRYLIKDRLDGIGRFTYEILKRVTAQHKEHTFIFIFDRPYCKEFIFSDNIIPVVLYPPARHPVLWYLFFEFSIPNLFRRYKPDIFLSMDGWLSLSTDIKSLPVVHDIVYERHPEFLPKFTRRYFRYFFPRFIKKAARVVTISKFSKNEIHEWYGIPADKIDIVSCSTRKNFYPLCEQEKFDTRIKYTSGKPYFLFIGPIHPQKNPENIIKAFNTFKRHTQCDFKLVMTGRTLWKHFYKPEKHEYKTMEQEIIFTGQVPSETLHRIIGSAFALLFVSFYEGFGMPILEAMGCHVPVITSNRASMPEVGSDAVLYAEPGSAESISNQMLTIYKDEPLRRQMIQRGINNLQRYSWQNSADAFWKSIEKVTINSH